MVPKGALKITIPDLEPMRGRHSNTPMRQRRRLPIRPRNISTVNTRSARRARMSGNSNGKQNKSKGSSNGSSSTNSSGRRRSARIASIANEQGRKIMSARDLARKNTLFLGYLMELKDEVNPDDDSVPVK